MRIARALVHLAAFAALGCSRSGLSLEADGTPRAAPEPTNHVPFSALPPPRDASVGTPPALVDGAVPRAPPPIASVPMPAPTPTTPTTPTPAPPHPPPLKKPKPIHPVRGDGGVEPPAAVLPDAGACEVAPLVPGRLVGIWTWDDELALSSWNTGNGTFESRGLRVSGSSVTMAEGPGEFAVVRIVREQSDGGLVDWVEMYRVQLGGDARGALSPSVRVRVGDARAAAVVWTGDGYLLAWSDPTGIWGQRISRDGNANGEARALFTGSPVYDLVLASRVPGEVGLLWEDYDRIRGAYFSVLDGGGTPETAPVWVTGSFHSAQHRLVATRRGYIASFVENTTRAMITVLNPRGEVVRRTQVDGACFSDSLCPPSSVDLYGGSSLAFNGCEIALLYTVPHGDSKRGLRLARLDEEGSLLESGIPVVDDVLPVWPRLGWDRSYGYWGVVWDEFDSTQVTYAPVSSGGVAFIRTTPDRGLWPTLDLHFVPDAAP